MNRELREIEVDCSDCGEIVYLQLTSYESEFFYSRPYSFISWPKSLQQKWEKTGFASTPTVLCAECFSRIEDNWEQ